jgi:hypothetical protein
MYPLCHSLLFLMQTLEKYRQHCAIFLILMQRSGAE